MTDDRLTSLYERTSKHSQYQVLAGPVAELISDHDLGVRSRHERERLDYLMTKVPWRGASLADIGGNTGFFTFELIGRGAGSALLVEGNRVHSDFVQEAVVRLDWQERVTVVPQYLRFDGDLAMVDVDVCLLLNVLHHIGDDFERNEVQTIQSAKRRMLDALNRLADHTRFLVVQIGFNWKGNVKLPLFEGGTKREMLDFIGGGTADRWTTRAVGIAEQTGAGIEYRDVSPVNIERQDELGEFLNRPLLIMESKQ